MKTPLDDLLKIPVNMLEMGLTAFDGGFKAIQTTIEVLSGQKSEPSLSRPPVSGPRNLDDALSDFANQLVRIGRRTRPEASEIIRATRETLATARRSFGYLDLRDPRIFGLAMALPLSAGRMLAESAVRGMSYYQALPARLFPVSVRNVIEMYCENGPFVSLEYKDLTDRYLERLKRQPNDAVTRLDLGQLYVKCGRYDDAVRELALAAKDPRCRAMALHFTQVAHHRAARFEQGAASGLAAMEADPRNERARLWLFLSATRMGGYAETVPAEYRMEMKAGYEPTTLRYEDIAAKIGLDKVSGGRGTAIFDYNNDGYLDIAITAGHGGCSLYRNNGDGTFTDVSIESGLDTCVNGFSIVAGDYDNDGFVDLFVTRLGFYPGDGTLYHNNGDGTFTDVTEKAGLQVWEPVFSGHWVDYDCDGKLDLFLAANVGGLFDRQSPHRLFHNNGDGTFTDVSAKCGLTTHSPAIGSAWGDYNNDGYPDLFLSGLGRPQLFRNNGDGTFTEVSRQAGFADSLIGSTCFWCDYDNDGWMDAVQYVWSEHEDVIHTMKTGKGPEDGQPIRIYHNNRDGTFTMKNREIGLDGCWGTMSGNCGDLNNDGYLDFLLGNGGSRMDRNEPLIILENDGAKFRNVSFTAGVPYTGKNHGVNCADLFGDGRLSILVAGGGLYPADLLASSVFYPKELLGNYLNVRLRGTKSNRDAIGARITLHAGGKQQTREIAGGTNFGCLPFEQHFGLGRLTAVDSLEIRWPGGQVQRVDNPPVNDTIRITEGEAGWVKVYRRPEC
ncbi:MAG: VCBS repeat-containing protein [Acidobacteria bacterium]|nr:VCBS repeat-containing protein [Acidobacteriota bacterium]